MKNETYNEQELQKLEEQIRAMGIPYSSNEPADRYFANFRVRLMERIDAKEKKSIFASVWSWLSSSPVRSISLGAGLAGIIIAALLIQPASQNEIAKVQPQPKAIEQPTIVAPQNPPEVAVVVPEVHKTYTSHRSNKNIASAKPRHNKFLEAANNAGNFATIDVRVSGDSDEPVNLESLSADELESVLAGVESMK